MDPIVPANTAETSALGRFLAEHLEAKQIPLASESVIVVPKGFDVKSVKPLLDEYLEAPERKRGTATIKELDSLVAHANAYKDGDSVLFCDPDKPSLTAVYDYNHAGAEGTARFGEHRARYPFPLSDQWTAWTGKNKVQMSQADFAAFIEERLLDVFPVPLVPAGGCDWSVLSEDAAELVKSMGGKPADRGRLQSLGRGLEVRANDSAAAVINLASGEARIQYTTEHSAKDEGGGPIEIPRVFVILIPVFKLGSLYHIVVRLRYRLSGGKITWWFELFRADEVRDHAIRKAAEKVATGTGLPLFFGRPETTKKTEEES